MSDILLESAAAFATIGDDERAARLLTYVNENPLRERIAALEAWALEACNALDQAGQQIDGEWGPSQDSTMPYDSLIARCPIQPDKEQSE